MARPEDSQQPRRPVRGASLRRSAGLPAGLRTRGKGDDLVRQEQAREAQRAEEARGGANAAREAAKPNQSGAATRPKRQLSAEAQQALAQRQAEADRKAAAAEADLQSILGALQGERSARKALKGQLDETTASRGELEDEVRRLREQLESQREQKDGQIRILQGRVDTKTTRVTELERIETENTAEIERLEAELAFVEQERDGIQDRFDRLVGALHTAAEEEESVAGGDGTGEGGS